MVLPRFMHRVAEAFAPPTRWRVPVIVAVGTLAGLLMLALYVGNATSYLSDQPETCVNCHVMDPQYASWEHGSHRRAATCNDCHVPHDNFVRKWLFKASDGARHAFVFTLRLEPQVIQVKSAGTRVIQENCKRCHAFTLCAVSARKVTAADAENGNGKLCWECHRETPHGRVSSLASMPYARIPRLEPIVPRWLSDYIGWTSREQTP